MSDTATDVDVRSTLKAPMPWKVILHNDDFTPMDFVVAVLVGVFGKRQAEAEVLMLAVHNQGRAIAGTYTKEIALTKVAQVREIATVHEHPLRATTEQM